MHWSVGEGGGGLGFGGTDFCLGLFKKNTLGHSFPRGGKMMPERQ